MLTLHALVLAAIGADWAEGVLSDLVPDLVSDLVAHGVVFED